MKTRMSYNLIKWCIDEYRKVSTQPPFLRNTVKFKKYSTERHLRNHKKDVENKNVSKCAFKAKIPSAPEPNSEVDHFPQMMP